MDLKEKIEVILEEIKKNPNIKEDFEKNPTKVIEKFVGVDLPDEIVDKIVDGVKAKIISQQIECKPGCPVTETAVYTTKYWR